MSGGGDLATLAILVSRVEALCLADMLNAEGIAVHIGAYCHGTVEIIPLALGGYRIMVPEAQWNQASELIRETAVHESWAFSAKARRAARQLFGFYTAYLVTWAGIGFALGTIPLSVLAMSPLSAFSLPLSPQARGSYYLADPATN